MFPDVPKYTPIDDYAFAIQYRKCVEVVKILTEATGLSVVSDHSIKIIQDIIRRCYTLAELTRAPYIQSKLDHVRHLESIITHINTPEGRLQLKKWNHIPNAMPSVD